MNASMFPPRPTRRRTRPTSNQGGGARWTLGGREAVRRARPRIVTRSGWGADESLRESGFVYTGSVKAAFVHHTASGNNYTCAQAPSVIRVSTAITW